MYLFSQKAGLDRDQQVIGQHAEKDVSLHSILELMEDRAFPERTLEIPKGILDSGQQNVDPPSLLGVEILAIRFQQIGAIHAKRPGLGLGLFLPEQLPRAGIEAEPVIPSHTRITLLQAADGLMDFRLHDPFLGDSRLETIQVGQEALLLLFANRPNAGPKVVTSPSRLYSPVRRSRRGCTHPGYSSENCLQANKVTESPSKLRRSLSKRFQALDKLQDQPSKLRQHLAKLKYSHSKLRRDISKLKYRVSKLHQSLSKLKYRRSVLFWRGSEGLQGRSRGLYRGFKGR